MKSRYKAECTEWDAQVVAILDRAMFATHVTGHADKTARYAAAIEAIADAYVERVESRIEKVYDVEVTRKSTATVVADSEDEARAKAVAGLGIHDGEAVTAEVQK